MVVVMENDKLSKEQIEILKLYEQEYLTIKQIAQRRKTSVQAVYKVINKLIKKGVLNKTNTLNGFKGGVAKWQRGLKLLRLHNIQLDIKIISKGVYYSKFLSRCNKLANFKGVTVMCYQDKLEVFTIKEMDFTGENTEVIYSKALTFLMRVLALIEQRLHITLLKDTYLNINWVRQHIAEVDSETAKDYHARNENIQYKDEQGVTWAISDKSKTDELEFIHSKNAKEHTDRVEKQLNDFRINNPPTISEISNSLMQAVQVINLQGEVTKNFMFVAAANMGIKLDDKGQIIKPAQETPAEPLQKSKKPDYIL